MNKNKLLILSVATFVILLAGIGLVNAYQSQKANTVVENAGGTVVINNEADTFGVSNGNEEDITFGAVGDYCDGTEATSTMCVLDIYSAQVGDLALTGPLSVKGRFDTYATSTLNENIYAPVVVSLDLNATSTAENPRETGVYCNDNVPLLVTNWTIDISSNNNVIGGNWTAGTTTATGDLSYTATSSATLMGSTHLNTSTEVVWNMHNDALAAGTYFEGSANATSTPFVLGSGDCFIVTNDLSGATSTVTDFDAGFVGKLYLETRIR